MEWQAAHSVQRVRPLVGSGSRNDRGRLLYTYFLELEML